MASSPSEAAKDAGGISCSSRTYAVDLKSLTNGQLAQGIEYEADDVEGDALWHSNSGSICDDENRVFSELQVSVLPREMVIVEALSFISTCIHVRPAYDGD
jgi:hypothetical protein